MYVPVAKVVELTVTTEPEPAQVTAAEADKLEDTGSGVTEKALPAPVAEEQPELVTTTFPLPLAPAGSATEIEVAEV